MARGSRSRISSATNGSRMNARITAIHRRDKHHAAEVENRDHHAQCDHGHGGDAALPARDSLRC